MIHCEILIIDDDQEDIDLLTDALYEKGMLKVHFVDSVTNAFNYLETVYPECIPGLIVTDMVMPGNTGADFFTELRSKEKYKGVQVVILSTSKFDQQLESLRKVGEIDFFLKPSSLDEYSTLAEDIIKKIAI
jgi:CheY-like chemotaxis protein